MTDFILGVFEITIGMSLFIVLLLLGLKLFGGKFTAKCRYIIWALVMIRLAIPFSFGLLPTLIEIPIDTELVQSEDLSSVLSENTDSVTSVQLSDPGDVVVTPTTPSTPVFPNVDTANPGSTPILPVTPTVPGDQTESVIPSDPVIETPTEQPVSLKQILDIAGIVYLTGAAIFLVWSLVSYFIYTRKILHSAKAADDRTQKIFSTICKKYRMKKQPTLLVASGIHSPAAFGIFRRKIVLPDIAFNENGLVGTLAHEVTHCKRGDLYMKLVELIACSLNWFNPLVHIAAFKCEMEMELSCDEKVLSGSSEAARAAYADVMLDIIRRCRRNRGALTTHFNPKKSAVTARFKNILYGSGKRRGRILIGVCLVLCVLAGAIVACQTGDNLPDDHWYAEGYYLKCDNGSDVIIMDADGANPASPCQMTPADDSVSFEGLTDGDRIKVEISMIMTTYPGQTEVYSIEKLSDGEREDIDSAVLDSLRELGWIDETEQNQAQLKEILITDDKLGQNSYMEYVHGYKLTQNGKYIISRYNACYPNSIPITEMWRYGILDRDGNEIIPCIYTEIIEDTNGAIYIVGKKGSYTEDAFVFISDEQASEIPAIADNSMYYISGKYPAMGYGDSNGNPLTDNVYSYCSPVNENGEAIVVKDRKTYIITLPTDRPKLPGYDTPQFASTSEEFGSEEIQKLVFTPRDAAGVVLYHRFTASNTYIFLCSVYDLDIYGSRIDAPPKSFAAYYTADFGKTIGIVDIKLPEDIEYDSVVPEAFGPGGGSMELQIILRLTKGNESFCVSFDNFTYSGDNFLGFEYRGIITEDAVESYKQLSIGTILEKVPVEPERFDPDTFFAASNPNMRADLLFWHRMFPAADNTYLYFCAIRNLNSTMSAYSDDPPKEFKIYWTRKGENFMAAEAELPDDLQYDSVCPVVVTDNGGGSGETEFIVQLTHGEKIFYASFDNFTWGDAQDAFTFLYRGILSDEEVNNLKAQYPDAFRKAEKFYWNYTLADFKNENPGSGLVYEGYTVEYTCESPYAGAFDFHIHLPQLNSNALYAEKWNYLYQEYDVQFGDYLRKTVHGTNTDYYVHITYDTVTTGDVVTIYIVKTHGILASGASTLDYDIYHYNMKTDRFLSTDEFIAYYAEGQFADYTVSDIVKFMNELCITTDEAGNPYPLTEKDIRGVIPSVYGDGKFDVVYHGYTVEGYHATRMLFSPYPTYGSKHQYTYRLTYHDYVDCEDKEMYGTPTGYRLLINQRVVGEYDAGYYVDCLFTEDIAEVPESYSLSEHGGYYTPVNQDAYGNMYVVVDHETNWGHLNAWIPFDMSGAAQDYYRGIHYKYFSYDRILNGINDSVNRNIAEMVAQVLHACRAGKDPNGLLPDSETLYIPYPLDAVRQDPTPEEVGEILKNTSVGESGIINFSMDLGDGWRMILPIDIGIFGESVQAYFTGVYYAHGTPVEKENAAEQTGQTDLQNLYQSILEDKTLVYSLSGEQGMYLSETFQSPNYTHHIIQYSIVDLNGDGTPELVCLTSSGNYTILHVEDNKVYAHSRAYRSFMELKEDGTFVWSGGASDWGIGRIDFDRYNQTRENIAFCRYDYDSNTEVYSVGNREASKEEFDACYAAQGQKPDAVWHEWTAQQETSAQPIDFSSIGGDWYHSFNYESWYAFYRLNFHSKTAEMQFDHGLYESEYDNRYRGTYTVDSTTQEITAVLHDDSTLHQDSDITLKFTLVVRTDGDEPTLVMHISSCNVEKYQHLVGQDLEFTREFGYAELEYQAAQNYYQMWYDKELTIDVLLDKSAVKKDIAKEVREATGMDLLVPSLTWEYTADEDRFPLRFFITDNGGNKMVETNIIRYKDEKDGMEKYAVEVNPTVISVE